MYIQKLITIPKYCSQISASGDIQLENNANENEVASIFARANDPESIISNIDSLSMPRADETKLLSQKMRILLTKGIIGLYKVFPEENKGHQVSKWLLNYIINIR